MKSVKHWSGIQASHKTIDVSKANMNTSDGTDFQLPLKQNKLELSTEPAITTLS